MKLERIILLLLTVVFSGKHLLAQGDCTINLNEAQKLYESGKIEKIPDLLDNCIESGFNKENKVAALRLLTLVYLYEDNNSKAEECFLKMLKKNPEYKINQNLDPIEFVRLYDSYHTRPIFSLGVKLAFNIDFAKCLQTYTFGNYDDADVKYTSGNGYSFGLKATYNVTNEWHLTIEPSFSSYSFEFSENFLGYNTIEGTSILAYIDVPLFGSYDFYTNGNTTLYGELGCSVGVSVSGDTEISRRYDNRENADVTGASIDMSDALKPVSLSGLIGIGAKLHVNHGFVSVGARYNIGLNNITDPDSRKLMNANPELTYKYRYMYNDISLSALSINLGYSYEIYIHKKKK